MNSQQRKYLIDKINEKKKIKIQELESQIKKRPSLIAYMLHEVLSDRIKVRENSELLEIVKKKALQALSDDKANNWLSNSDRWGSQKEDKVSFDLNEFFVIPENYKSIISEVDKHNLEIRNQIYQLSIQCESLETRIMLASDKTLQKMINEVDDMGDISLIDTKIKLLQ